MLEAGAPISPPTSVPASPVFEWSKIGTDWDADGSTLIASGMLAEERYAVGSKIVRSGKTTFTYTINKVFFPDAHLFVGVAEITDDPENAKTWAFNGPTGNLWVLLRSLAASCKAMRASDVCKPERHSGILAPSSTNTDRSSARCTYTPSRKVRPSVIRRA
jgi:hypothetical protein